MKQESMKFSLGEDKFITVKDIRLQLNEQLRCLDLRMDTQTAVIGELQDYFRKRAEVELDYSKSLDKLAKSLQLRHKEQKQKREQWSLVSSFSCWQHLVAQTKNMSRDHALLSEIYSSHVINRFSQIIEDVQRIYKKCRDIAYELHEELMRVLHELHATTKAYLAYQTEARQAEAKLRSTEAARNKIEASLPKEKLERSKKFRVVEKEVQKRKNKYFDAKLKALKARNEYTLCLESSNATIHKYFVEDLSDLMDCMDFGFHHCVSRALLMHISAEQGRQKSESNGLDTFQNLVQGMDSRLDKQKFMEYNHSAFMIPKKFEFQGQKDEFAEPELQKLLCCEMETRLVQINQRLTSLKTESEEIWKTLETAELSLLEMLTAKDYDCSESFINGHTSTTPSSGSTVTTCATSLTPAPPETVSIKLRADRHETEEFYLTKLREYLLGTSRIARLDTKQTHIRSTLLEQHNTSPSSPPHSLCSPSSENGNASSNTPPGEQLRTTNGSPLNGCLLATPASTKPVRRKRIGRSHQTSTPKLFGGSLEEYVEATGQEIPLVVRSCIRVINLYGLHHQGIFRVSGSQLEINSFKELFEKGEDALQDMTDSVRSDMNSIAGVFKLYLRELREPLFPLIYFEQFMQLSQLESKHEFVVRMRDLLSSLPRPALVLLRYIFAFLNHLSEYADENMMDPYNLAICFGPTLVPVPDDKDQVQYQNQVNELIKNVILFSDDIFPSPSIVPGPIYEKYISASGMMEEEELLLDIGECPSESITVPTETCCPYPSEDECDSLEATAQFEFLARSERELSLKKGDHITLFSQVSNDWWRGSVHGHEGLIPDKYIMLKIKDETGSDKVESGSGGGATLPGGGAKHSSCSSTTPSSSSSSEESPLLLSSGRRRRVSSSNDSVISGNSSSAHISGAGGTGGALSQSSVGSRGDNISTSETCSLVSYSSLDSSYQNKITQSLNRELETKFRTSSRGQTHCKSASVDEKMLTKDDSHLQYRSKTALDLSSNRQRRASSHSHLSGEVKLSLSKEQEEEEEEGAVCRWSEDGGGSRNSKDTPDLVMDLPELRLNHDSLPSSGVVSPIINPLPVSASDTEPVSPDMSSTAERFARHQCTLRKKPEKPALMRKPVITPGQQQHSPLILRHRYQTRSTEDTGQATVTTTVAASTIEQEIQTE